VIEELAQHFTTTHRGAFPVPLPIQWCNLFLGMTLRPKT